MNVKQMICAAMGIFMSLSSCAQKKGTEMAENTEKNAGKVLVAYFSATGTTRKVAEDLSKVMEADLFEIRSEQEYTDADLDWNDSTSRSSREMRNTDFRPPVAANMENIGDYDTVFIGFPIWWYIAPTIVNTFIENNNLDGKTVVCFATSGGSPIKPCVENLKKQYPSINWTEGKLLNHASKQDLLNWKKELGY